MDEAKIMKNAAEELLKALQEGRVDQMDLKVLVSSDNVETEEPVKGSAPAGRTEICSKCGREIVVEEDDNYETRVEEEDE